MTISYTFSLKVTGETISTLLYFWLNKLHVLTKTYFQTWHTFTINMHHHMVPFCMRASFSGFQQNISLYIACALSILKGMGRASSYFSRKGPTLLIKKKEKEKLPALKCKCSWCLLLKYYFLSIVIIFNSL